MKGLKKSFLRLAYTLLKGYWFLFRPQTTGVRCLLIKGDEILLIKHSYGSDYWTVPGGGVKTNESLSEAAKRETLEEVGIEVQNTNKLGPIFYDGEYKRDTIWVFQTNIETSEFNIDELEIINAKWFPVDKLPENSSKLLKKYLTLYHPKPF